MYQIADKNLQYLSGNVEDYPEGIVMPVDKPYRWTSADVIRKLKFTAYHKFKKKNLKVGHAGTLDPLATGILLVCIGNACKKAQELMDHDKEYVADICFGAATPSYDLETEIDRRMPYEHISAEAIQDVLKGMIGEQEQIAPLFSAKSVDGVRAYELARKLYKEGKGLDSAGILHTSHIRINELELIEFFKEGIPAEKAALEQEYIANGASSRIKVSECYNEKLPTARIRISCTKGTYIRSLARDLGEALGSVAHLSSLTRIRSGEFKLEMAQSMAQALELLKAE